MSALWYQARADLRARWRVWVGLALLLGFAGGVALCAFAGARRTTSAYPRLLDETNAFDVLVNPNDGEMDLSLVESLPGVARSGRAYGALVLPRDPDGKPVLDFEGPTPFVSRSIIGFELNRPKIEEGRLPDPDRADEALVTPAGAEAEGFEVGTRLDFVAFTEQDARQIFPRGPNGPPAPLEDWPPGRPGSVTIVGIGSLPDEATAEPVEGINPMLLTPAFDDRYRPLAFFEASMLELEPGTDIDAFVGAAQRAAPSEQVFYQTRPKLLDKVDRAVRPYVSALYAFAAVAAAATLLIVGQALARQLALDGTGYSLLGALGITRNQLFAIAFARVVAVAVAGMAIAVGVAVLLSPLTPVGSVPRDIEPDPGFWWDGTALLGGAVLGMVLVCAAVAWPAWRAARLGAAPAGSVSLRERVGLAGVIGRAGFAVPASTGVSMALEAGRGATAVPVRATITGAALSVTALCAALVFGTSLDHFLETPRLYGADYDAFVDFGPDAENVADIAGADAALGADAGVAAYTRGAHGQVAINERQAPAIGLEYREGTVHPTVLEGRVPRTPDEIALGTTTLDETGTEVGDTAVVSVGPRTREMQVVGAVVFPRFAAYPGADKTGLGTGAALTADGLRHFVPNASPSFFLVGFGDGIDEDAATADLSSSMERFQRDDEFARPAKLPDRPDDVAGYEDVRTLPVGLAVLLLLLAGGTTAHALVSSVRRRRRDLAVLKTLGFARRQVSATIAWQASTVAVAALLIGIPLGLIAGRVGWTWMAEQIGAVAEPAVSVVLVALVVPVVLAAANVISALPARSAARTRPAIVLRSE